MVRKYLCHGNDDNNDDGDGDDDVKRSFYKNFKEIMIYIEVTKVQECFKRGFCYKLSCRKLLLVAHALVIFSDGIDCHI